MGSQNSAKSERGWHTNLHPISMLYFYPHLVNNEHPLTYHWANLIVPPALAMGAQEDQASPRLVIAGALG